MSNMLKTTATSNPWNLPNAITMARILAVPFFIWSLVSFADNESPLRWISELIFIVIMASDGIDGAIARKRGIVTDLGKLLDPIADKALLGGALVTLSILGEIAWWVTIVILVRELGITVYRLVVVNQQVSVPRHIRRPVRAAVHRVEQGGVAQWDGAEQSAAALRGRLAFVKMVHAQEGRALLRRLLQAGAVTEAGLEGAQAAEQNPLTEDGDETQA
jgi:phosphatidylglycerophosphate synthase